MIEVTAGPHFDWLDRCRRARRCSATPWTVSRQSDRTGIRLSGPKVGFSARARRQGAGERARADQRHQHRLRRSAASISAATRRSSCRSTGRARAASSRRCRDRLGGAVARSASSARTGRSSSAACRSTRRSPCGGRSSGMVGRRASSDGTPRDGARHERRGRTPADGARRAVRGARHHARASAARRR